MTSLVFFTLWMLARPQTSTTHPPAHSQNVVRICSLASGGSPTGCQDLDARLLEPGAGAMVTAGAAGGQRAFLDPTTKSLVQPNQDQLKELSIILSESMDRRAEEAKVEILPNGTLRLAGEGFILYSKAVIEDKEKKP